MKLSEMIEKLETIKKESGDLRVVTFEAIYGYLPIEDIDSQKVGENSISIEFEF